MVSSSLLNVRIVELVGASSGGSQSRREPARCGTRGAGARNANPVDSASKAIIAVPRSKPTLLLLLLLLLRVAIEVMIECVTVFVIAFVMVL